MTDKWEYYPCGVENSLAFVFVDVGLIDSIPDRKRPTSLRVRVYLQVPEPNGMPASAEFSALRAIEKALIPVMERAADAVFVGRVTTAGHRDFYFYVPDWADGQSAVQELAVPFPAYLFEGQSMPDSDWLQYKEFLYPNKLGWQSIANLHVIETLEEHDDQLHIPRTVDHFAYFSEERSAQGFAAAIGRNGFTVNSVGERAQQREWAVLFQREHAVESDIIDPITFLLVRLAEEFSGEYDGWETVIVKPE